MINVNLHLSSMVIAVILLAALPSCGPGEAASECVAVDEQLGVPADREWCGGEFSAKDVAGEFADKELALCLPPLPSGECELCPTEKVVADVERERLENLDEYRPGCELDHWEFGCMRTTENAMTELGRETDYCCFQVALWGEGCRDQGG